MDQQKKEEEASKLCDEVIATISVAVNLHMDRRVPRVVSRTFSRDRILKACMELLTTEYHDEQSCHNVAVPKAHTNISEGGDKQG